MEPFGESELERYARHLVLPEIGGAGQQKLKRGRVLVVGAGGLGSPVLQYLAAAGIGTLGVIDDDVVSLSNLQRQIIHATEAVGRPKVDSAKEAIAALNPHVAVEAHWQRMREDNVDEIISAYDIVVDGSDNFATRYMVADASQRCERPLVAGAVGRFDGSLTVLKPFEREADGRLNPSLRDLFPEPPPEGMVPSCAEAGIVGALTGVIGTLQAMEVVKLLTGIGEPLVGRILLYDALAARFEIMKYGAPAEKSAGA